MDFKKLISSLPLFVLLSSCRRTYNEVGEKKSNLREPVMDRNAGEKFDILNPTGSKISFTAELIRIVDGDTAEILNGELPIKIRLQHIDAPEKRGSQAYGKKAKIILSQLCFGQEVIIVTDGDFDMGGRLVAEIINVEGLNVNKEMVRLGNA